MRKRIEGIIAGILITLLLLSGVVSAESISKKIEAVYMNIKLVVDGAQVEPKDANGNYIEPFVYNGTTYLPVRAIGQAFKKEVTWDGSTATVFIGGKVDKPAKEIDIWKKSYIDNTLPNSFSVREENGHGYMRFSALYNILKEVNGSYQGECTVSYPLNGKAVSAKGALVNLDGSANGDNVIFEFYDENDKLLWKSNSIIEGIDPVNFEFNTGKALQLKIKAKYTVYIANQITCEIKDFKIITTDY